MVKILKNNINKIFIAITLMLILIGITFLTTKTYAYSIDNNGNLVGDNLFDINGQTDHKSANISIDTQTNMICTNNIFGNSQYIIYSDIYSSGTYTINLNIEDSIINSVSNEYRLLCSNGAFGTQLDFYNNYYYIDLTGGTPFTFTSNSEFKIGFVFISNTQTYEQTKIYKNIMLNKGSSALDWEPYGVWYNEFNYDTLENNYNELYNYNKYGWLKYIDNLDLSIGGTFIEEYNFNQLVSNNYISNNKINVYDLTRISNPNYTYSNIEIYFNDSIKNKDTFSYNLFSLTSNGDYASSIVSIYDDEDHVATFEFSNELVSITPEAIINKNNLFNGNIYNITIYNSSPDSAINYYTDSNYGNGYQSGYNYGRTIADSIERELNNKIKEKNNQIEQLEIEKQQAYNNGYTTGYNEGNTNSNGLYNMVIAVADTPISIFKQIFNFNILGLDISGFIFGIISLLIIVWLIKKII